jgi:outer membrane protein TolC
MRLERQLLAVGLVAWTIMAPVLGANGDDLGPAEGVPLTLEGAVQRALQANPRLEAMAAGIEAADADVARAKAGLMPSLQFKQDYTNSNNPVYVFGSLLEQSRFGEPNFDVNFLNNPPSINNFRTALNLRIPIFNRWQVYSQIDSARLRVEQAGWDQSWAQHQITFQVVQGYFGVLLAEARREVAQEAVRTAEAELEAIRSRLDQGLVVKSALLAMEVQLADFRQQLAQATGDEEMAWAALNTVLALPIDVRQELAGALDERSFPLPSRGDLIRLAMTQRPDYRKAAANVDLAEQQVRSARGDYLPDLNVFASVGRSSHNLADGSGDFAVGASLTFDIVDLGRSPRIQQAVAESRGAQAQERAAANEIRFEVVQAYQQFVTAREQLNVARAAVDQGVEALRIVEDRHEVGLTTVTEVLRAQTALLRARLNLLGARYGHYIGFAKTLLVSGGLTDVRGLVS